MDRLVGMVGGGRSSWSRDFLRVQRNGLSSDHVQTFSLLSSYTLTRKRFPKIRSPLLPFCFSSDIGSSSSSLHFDLFLTVLLIFYFFNVASLICILNAQ